MRIVPSRRLLVIVTEAGVLFAVSYVAVLASMALIPGMRGYRTLAALAIILVPDGMAGWWLFRRLQTDNDRTDARRGVIAFASSAPVTLGIGLILSPLVGGYAEKLLGVHFILPSIVVL